MTLEMISLRLPALSMVTQLGAAPHVKTIWQQLSIPPVQIGPVHSGRGRIDGYVAGSGVHPANHSEASQVFPSQRVAGSIPQLAPQRRDQCPAVRVQGRVVRYGLRSHVAFLRVEARRLRSALAARRRGHGRGVSGEGSPAGREVAIKILPSDRLGDETRRRRFVQEAQAASALNHPHIVTIHEIESAGDRDFIVMEYVRGRSLDTAIPRGGLRLGELLRIAIPVADALGAAHARGIVHRDLKPANVMIGGDGAVKVLDFGLAKRIGRGDGPDEHGHARRGPGTESAGDDRGDRRLHGARAGDRRHGGRAERHLQLRRHALRDGHRCASVWRQDSAIRWRPSSGRSQRHPPKSCPGCRASSSG